MDQEKVQAFLRIHDGARQMSLEVPASEKWTICIALQDYALYARDKGHDATAASVWALYEYLAKQCEEYELSRESAA